MEKELTIKEELLEIGFLSGSRAYGTAVDKLRRVDEMEHNTSDWDIVVSIKDIQKVDLILMGLPRKQSDYFNGFYVIVDNELLNIIPVHPSAYEDWYLTTKCMTTLLSEVELPKTIKCSVFEGFKSLISLTREERIIK